MPGYIRIDRRITEWEWYKNEHTKNVFLHCLIKANWKDSKFEGKDIKRGSFITSIRKIASELDLTDDEVRTALKHLQKTGEITKQTTNKYTVITVSNYEFYQDDPKQIPNKSQPIPNLFPTIEKEKEEEKGNNKNTMRKSDALALFERLWKLYPLKRGKGQVSESAKIRLLSIGEEELMRCIDRYKSDLKNEAWRKPQNGSTFFNNGYVDYLDENYEKPKLDTRSVKGANFQQREYDMVALERQLAGGIDNGNN